MFPCLAVAPSRREPEFLREDEEQNMGYITPFFCIVNEVSFGFGDEQRRLDLLCRALWLILESSRRSRTIVAIGSVPIE